jgi:hypothetical protein
MGYEYNENMFHVHTSSILPILHSDVGWSACGCKFNLANLGFHGQKLAKLLHKFMSRLDHMVKLALQI